MEALVKKSEERKVEKAEQSVKRMPSSKYYSYFVMFGEIYKQMIGMNYFPGVRDLNYIRRVVLLLNEKNLGFNEYVSWVCRVYRFHVMKLGTLALVKYVNIYLEQRNRGQL
jgi:hypothetical protein